MQNQFYVIDHEGNVSWRSDEKDSRNEGPESFPTEAKAIARAKKMAATVPGEQVFVCKAIKSVRAPVGTPGIEDL